MIVKIQQSLFHSEGETSVLIYDESREHMYETSDPTETGPILELLGEREKAYFNAEIVDTRFAIDDEVDPQPW